MDWKNRVVLITGASSGIGRALSVELAHRGAMVGLLARREDLLRDLVAEIETRGGKAIALPADVTDANAVRSAVAVLTQKFGPVDLLIANAGVGATTSGSKLEPDGVAKVFSVNVNGVINCVTAVMPQMIERGRGQLAVISSLAAYRGLPKSAAYCASKAAISSLFESLRLDLQPRGIDVTIIHPGFIRTPLTAGRTKKLPFLLEVDVAANKMIGAIEKRKKSYAFPWQLATVVRLGMVMPNFMYDWIARRNSFRE